VFLLVEQVTVLVTTQDIGLGEMVGCCGLSKGWYGMVLGVQILDCG
jgi:hypothetical protein